MNGRSMSGRPFVVWRPFVVGFLRWARRAETSPFPVEGNSPDLSGPLPAIPITASIGAGFRMSSEGQNWREVASQDAYWLCWARQS
jgi:hypothetical protein